MTETLASRRCMLPGRKFTRTTRLYWKMECYVLARFSSLRMPATPLFACFPQLRHINLAWLSRVCFRLRHFPRGFPKTLKFGIGHLAKTVPKIFKVEW